MTASCSGFASPGFDLGLLEMLPLRRDVARTHVGFMGCHAAFNAWRVAAAFAKCNHAGAGVSVLCRVMHLAPAVFYELPSRLLRTPCLQMVRQRSSRIRLKNPVSMTGNWSTSKVLSCHRQGN